MKAPALAGLRELAYACGPRHRERHFRARPIGRRGRGRRGRPLQRRAAAGLLSVPLVPLTAAFFSGRLVSYSLYVGGASLAEDSLGSIFTDSLTSPTGVALQLAMLVLVVLVVLVLLVVLLVKVDWARFIGRHRDPRRAQPASQ